jgi:MFS family permease
MPSRLGRFIGRLIPPTPLSRRLAVQSLLFSTGAGTFNTGSAVFFTQVVGLSAAKVGLGMTIAGVVSFFVAYPAGKMVDRIGTKRMWAAGTLAGSTLFAVWPWMHGFTQYVAMSVAFEIVNNIAFAGYNAYMLNVLPARERIDTQAHLYSALNLGFTLGAIIGGIALAFDSITLIRWLPLLTTAIGVVNAARILRLPDPPHEAAPEPALAELADAAEPATATQSPGALRNRGWLGVSFFSGILWTNQTLLNVVIPLWLVQRTDAPHWILAWLFGTNTVLCIFLPQFTAKGVNTITDALRRARWATGFFVASCLITMATHSVAAFWAALLVWLGHVTVTGAELAIGSGSWAFQAKLMDPERRGEYTGAQEVAKTMGQWWAPAAYTWLAMTQGDIGWMVIALIAVVGAIGLHPSARAAERFAAQHFTDRDVVDVP